MFTSVVLFSLVFIAILLVGVMFVLFRQLSTLEKYQAALDDAAEKMLAMSRSFQHPPPGSHSYPPPPPPHRRIAMESSALLPQPGYHGSQVDLISYQVGQDTTAMSGFHFPQLTPPMTGHIPLTPLPPLQLPPHLSPSHNESPPPIPCEQCGSPLQDDLLFCVKCGKTHSSLMFPATGSQPRVATPPLQTSLTIDPELFPDARTIKTIRPTEEELQGSKKSPAPSTTGPDGPALTIFHPAPETQLASQEPEANPLDPTPRDQTRKEAPGAAAASSLKASQDPSDSELYTREHGRPDELLKDASALLDLAQTPEELQRKQESNAGLPITPPRVGSANLSKTEPTAAFQSAPAHTSSSGELPATASQGPSNASLNALAQVFPPDIDLLLRSTSSYPTAVQVFRPGNANQTTSPHDSNPGQSNTHSHALSIDDFNEALRNARAYLALEDDPQNALQFLLGMAINQVEAADSAILVFHHNDEQTASDTTNAAKPTSLYQLTFSIAIGDQFDALLHRHIPIDQGMLGYCVEERAGLLIDDASLEASFQQGMLFEAGLSLGSFLCVPLLHDEAFFGVLLLRNPPEDDPFSLGELHILTYLAHLMGEILHKVDATMLPSHPKQSVSSTSSPQQESGYASHTDAPARTSTAPYSLNKDPIQDKETPLPTVPNSHIPGIKATNPTPSKPNQ